MRCHLFPPGPSLCLERRGDRLRAAVRHDLANDRAARRVLHGCPRSYHPSPLRQLKPYHSPDPNPHPNPNPSPNLNPNPNPSPNPNPNPNPTPTLTPTPNQPQLQPQPYPQPYQHCIDLLGQPAAFARAQALPARHRPGASPLACLLPYLRSHLLTSSLTHLLTDTYLRLTTYCLNVQAIRHLFDKEGAVTSKEDGKPPAAAPAAAAAGDVKVDIAQV